MSNKVRLTQAVLIIRFDSEDLGYTGTMSSIHKADIKRLYREYATFSNDVIDDSVMHTISRHETLVEIPSNHINNIDMTTGIYKSTAVVRQRQVLLELILLPTSVTHPSLCYPLWTCPPHLDAGSPQSVFVTLDSYLFLSPSVVTCLC